jgi:hypothetical protein
MSAVDPKRRLDGQLRCPFARVLRTVAQPMSAPDLWVHALGDPEFGKISFDGMHYARVSREG